MRLYLLQWVLFVTIFCQLIYRPLCGTKLIHQFLDPGFSGYYLDTNESLKPTTTEMKPAADDILDVVTVPVMLTIASVSTVTTQNLIM